MNASISVFGFWGTATYYLSSPLVTALAIAEANSANGVSSLVASPPSVSSYIVSSFLTFSFLLVILSIIANVYVVLFEFTVAY